MRELNLGESLEVLIDHRGKTPKKLGGDFISQGVPVVSAMLVQDGRIKLDDARKVSVEMYERWMPVTMRRHDVILTSEAPLGRVALVPADLPLVLGQRVYGLRGKAGLLDSRFLYYVLQTDSVQADMQGRASGTTVLGIRQSELVKVMIPAPDISVQMSIAALLGALDDKIAVNERIERSVLVLASSLYEHASCSLSWRDISLGATARWYSGGTPSTNESMYWGGETPWISAKSLKSPWIDDSERRLTPLGLQNGTRVVPAGTIIFVVRGSSLKDEFRLGITQREVAFGQDCKALLAHDGIDSDVLFHAIRCRTRDILDLVDETSIGAGRLSTDLIAKLGVRVPGDSADVAVEKLRTLDAIGALKQRESRALAQLRDTLLPKLMSGQIRIKDAERLVEDAV